jgi:hypothetical protein
MMVGAFVSCNGVLGGRRRRPTPPPIESGERGKQDNDRERRRSDPDPTRGTQPSTRYGILIRGASAHRAIPFVVVHHAAQVETPIDEEV